MSESKEANGGNTGSASWIGVERGLLSEFNASVLLPSNTSGAIAPPLALSTTPLVIAALFGPTALNIDDLNDRVLLTATVGWQAITNVGGKVDVIFRIYRNASITGPLIFSARESAEATIDDFRTSSFSHVDLTPITVPGQQAVSYFLTAELALAGSAANIIGPLTFAGAEIEPNRLFLP